MATIELMPKGVKLIVDNEEYNYTFFPLQCDRISWDIGTLDSTTFTLRADTYRALDKESRKIYSQIKDILPDLFQILCYYKNNKVLLATLEVGFEYIYNLPNVSNHIKMHLLRNLLCNPYLFRQINKVYNTLITEAIDEMANRLTAYPDLSQGAIARKYYEKINERVYASQYALYSDVLTIEDFIKYRKEPLFKRMVKILRNENAIIQNIQKEVEKLSAIVQQDGYDDKAIDIKVAFDIKLSQPYCLMNDLKEIADIAKQLENNVTWKEIKTYKQVQDYLKQLQIDLANFKNPIANELFSKNQKATLKDYENEIYKVIIPLNIGECIKYGDRLSNCLGHFEWNTYLKNGKRAAFVVLNKTTNKYVACVDLSIPNKKVCQSLGPCNSTLQNQELISFINTYITIIKAR